MLRIRRKKARAGDPVVSPGDAAETPQNAVGELLGEGAEASFAVDAYPTSAVKRWLDIIGASVALGVLAPIWLLALILIKLDDFVGERSPQVSAEVQAAVERFNEMIQ